MARHDVVALVDRRQVKPDHVLEQHEHVHSSGSGHRNEARLRLARDVDDGQGGVREDRWRRWPNGHHETERAISEIRKGLAGVNSQGRQDRKQAAAEVLFEKPRLILGHLLGAEQEDSFRRQQRLDLVDEAAVLLVHELADTRGHRRKGFRRRAAAGPDAALQFRHADHEELVQVRAEVGEALHPFEQRQGWILRVLEKAPVELEPREVPIDRNIGIHVSLVFNARVVTIS